MIFVYPNTLSTFTGDRANALSAGYIEIENDVYADLVETKKKWDNGSIVDDSTYSERKAQEEEEKKQREEEEAKQAQINALKRWFNEDYRMYNEMLTRWAAMGISETITDEIRGKTYTNLTELYTEAEVVRAEIQALED